MKNYQDQMCPEVREREEGTHWLSKRENVTMPSINTACLSSVELAWEAGKTEAMLALSLCRVPIHSSDWASDGEQKTEAIQGNHRSRSTDCPWQVLSNSAWPIEAHSHPQKLQNSTDNESKRKIWHCQMDYNKQEQTVQTLLSHA